MAPNGQQTTVKLGWPEESSLFHLMCLTGRYHRDGLNQSSEKKDTEREIEPLSKGGSRQLALVRR